MATVYGQKLITSAVTRHREVRGEIRRVTNRVDHRASRNLAKARGSTRWYKIHGPAHLTQVGSFIDGSDGVIYLQAPNAMAIEFGHGPSGVFGPGGEYGHLETKAPHGLYILTRAASLAGSNVTPARGRVK